MKLYRTTIDGFTLIELVITVSIAAILFTIGMPSYQKMVMDKRMATTRETLITDLEIAKSEAMTRNQSVILCRHSGETATPTACDNTAEWENGWVVFVDTNGDSNVDANELLRVTAGLGAGLNIDYSKTSITFSSRGFTGTTNGTFRICDGRGYQHGHKLILSTSGFIQTENATDCPS